MQTSKNNGRKATSGSFQPRPLPAHDAHDQIHRRASCGSAKTHLDYRTMADLAITCAGLFDQCLRLQGLQPIELDEIDARGMAGRVTSMIQAHPLIVDASPSHLNRRAKILRELHAGRPSRFGRALSEQCEKVVDNCIEAIVKQCGSQLELAPHALARALPRIEMELASIDFPEPDATAYSRFKHAYEAIEALERQADLLPARTRDRVLPNLREYAADGFDNALAARCLDLINEHLRTGIRQLRSVLGDIKTAVHQLQSGLEGLHRALEAERTQSYRLHAVSASSNLLRLDGQSESELMAGLKARLKVESSAELAEYIFEQLVRRLNDVARERYPLITMPAGPTTLLGRIRPAETAVVLQQLLRELIGDSFSVYASIRVLGVEEAVGELLQRCSPLCRLRSRDRAIFGVEAARMTVVRLPVPMGPEDQQTYHDVRDAFIGSPNTKCVDAPPTERDITVVRTIVGFPIAIESNQETLLEYYATAEPVRHLPHLFGVIPNSDGGWPLQDLKRVFEALGETADSSGS